MIKIAVVDDEEKYALSLKNAILSYGKERGIAFEVDVFRSAYALDEDEGKYQILFLDIQMPGKDGMAYAKEIRERNPKILICFTTSFAQFAIKGYEVSAVDYLLKPIGGAEFATKFTRILNFLPKDEGKSMLVKSKQGSVQISLNEILYVESVGHNLLYHLQKGKTLQERASLKDAERTLTEKEGFARCNAPFLVNLRKVRMLKGNEVEMENGDTLPISQGKKREFVAKMASLFSNRG